MPHALIDSLSPELRLLLAAGYLQLSDEQCAYMATLLQGEMDWDRLLHLGRMHGMLPLLSYHWRDVRLGEAVNQVPPEIFEAVQATRRSNAAWSLQLGLELERVGALFSAHNIPIIPYKGVALARRLYGDESLRESGDLDILVQCEDVEKGLELLRQEGYESVFDFISPQQEQIYRQQSFEYELYHPVRKIRLELHWDVIQTHHSITLDWNEIRAKAQGTSVQSVAPEYLLILLVSNQ